MRSLGDVEMFIMIKVGHLTSYPAGIRTLCNQIHRTHGLELLQSPLHLLSHMPVVISGLRNLESATLGLVTNLCPRAVSKRETLYNGRSSFKFEQG